jgi:hypothetical protein
LLATFPSSALGQAVDADAAYVITMDSLMRVPLSGGSAQPLVSDQFCCSGVPQVTTTEVIWAQGVFPKLRVRAVSKTGGPPRTILSDQPVAGIATDGSTLFWTLYETPDSSPVGSIRSSPLQGGAVTVLLTVPDAIFQDLVVDAARIYFTQGTRSASSPVPTGLFSMKKDGTDLTAMRIASTCCLSVDPPRLFWVENQVLWQMDLPSGATTDVAPVVRSGSSSPLWVHADRSGGVGVFRRCDFGESEFAPSHCGGVVMDVGSGQVLAYADDSVPSNRWWTMSAAMDGTHVYWSPGGLELRRVPRR